MSWLLWSLLALAFWGVWGAVAKVALEGLDWPQVLLFGSVVSLVLAIAIGLVTRPELAVPTDRLVPVFAAAALGTFGTIALYVALRSGGPASVVIPFTAAYPVVTALLSIAVLREQPEPAKLAAAGLFIIATILVSR